MTRKRKAEPEQATPELSTSQQTVLIEMLGREGHAYSGSRYRDFSVSEGTASDALHVLADAGLVTLREGSSPYIYDLTVDGRQAARGARQARDREWAAG